MPHNECFLFPFETIYIIYSTLIIYFNAITNIYMYTGTWIKTYIYTVIHILLLVLYNKETFIDNLLTCPE